MLHEQHVVMLPLTHMQLHTEVSRTQLIHVFRDNVMLLSQGQACHEYL